MVSVSFFFEYYLGRWSASLKKNTHTQTPDIYCRIIYSMISFFSNSVCDWVIVTLSTFWWRFIHIPSMFLLCPRLESIDYILSMYVCWLDHNLICFFVFFFFFYSSLIIRFVCIKHMAFVCVYEFKDRSRRVSIFH